MNNFDEEAFVREMQHKETMNKQRADAIRITQEIPYNHYEIKDDNNEKLIRSDARLGK